MRGEYQSLDLVVGSGDGLSLVLSAAQLTERLVLVGALVDPEAPPHVETSIEVDFAPELTEGSHVRRDATWILEVAGSEGSFTWQVESRELLDGYVLQDPRVRGDLGELRVFAFEDLAATVGVGLAVAPGAVYLWLKERRLDEASEEANAKWQECLAAGRTPSWVFGVQDEASLDPTGLPRLKLRRSIPFGATEQL